MAKKNFGKRTLAALLSIIMIFSMVNISVLAAGEPELVRNYEDTYYKQDGSVGSEQDWEIHLSKQAQATDTENVYDITLTVETKDTSVELTGATHGAVTLVLDVSNSMNKRYAACTVDGCGEDEGHPTHHEYDEAYLVFLPLGFCSECWRGKSAHANGHDYRGDSDTHLENLQEAVASFLDSYADGANEGDKRLVSVAVFGTDAVTIQEWVDVTDEDAREDVKALVNSLSTGDGAYLGSEYLTNGGTNIEAGLVLGRNLLNDTEALAGIPVGNQSLILFSDGAPTARVGNVNSTSVTEVTYGGNDTGSQTDAADYDDIDNILDDISAATIAVQYNYEDENNVLSDFDRVINSSADTLSVDLTGEAGKVITTETTPSVITDPMGEGVSMVSVTTAYNETSETWNLADYTPVVVDGVTTYTITYQVEIDPTVIEADPDYEGYTILTPANGTTTLDYTVGEDETPVEAEFNVPDIRGILPRFDLTVNYVDEQGAAIAEQVVETDILYGKDYETEQKEIEHYEFKALAEGSDPVSGTITNHTTVTYVYSQILYPVSYEYTGEVPENAPELPEGGEYTFGAEVIVADEPELEGYTFSGWDKEDFEMPAENVVIKGSWTVIPKYTVAYEYINAPEGAPALPETVEYEVGAQVTVAADAYLEGYVFSGWDKEDFEMPAENVVIKGSWTIIPPNKYNVVYQYTDEIPENAPALPETKQYEEGDAVIVAAAPELDGYTFSGWDKEDFTMPAEDVIIKGTWTAIPKYPVSYEYIDAPEGAPALPETVEYQAGAEVTVADEPTLGGYTFSGWDKEDFEMPAEAVVIKGSWTKDPDPKYTVSYEYINAPEGAPALPETVEYEAGAQVTVADEPALDGYTFSGWDKEDFEMPAENVVIKGSWTAIPKYTVAYEYINAPEGAPTLPETVEYEVGAQVTVAADAYLEGYVFSGWDKEDFKMPAQNVVIKGSWTKKEVPPPIVFNVTYAYTGEVPEGAPAVPAGAQYGPGAEVTVAEAPEFRGYTFSGWDTEDAQIVDGKFAMPETHVVLKGSWTKNAPPPPKTGSLVITKTTKGLENGDVLPDDVAFIVYKDISNGTQVAGIVTYGEFTDGTYTMEVETGRYTVEEDDFMIDGYTWKGTEVLYDKLFWNEYATVTKNGTATVEITNTYEKRSTVPVTYTVSYEYTGEVPELAPQVPGSVRYAAGAEVTVAAAPELEGYTFSGWDKEDFKMPAQNVVIKGSWTAIPKYTVSYEYTGTIPANAPELPATAQYEAGAEVTVADAPGVTRYTFSGWTTQDTQIEDGRFIMPEQDVKLVGSWRRRALPVTPPVTPTPDPDPVTPTPDPVIPDPDPVVPDPVVPDPVVPDPVVPDPVTPDPVVPVEPDEPIDIPDEEVPLIDEPDLPEPPVDIPDEEVPLADVPKTDDKLALYVTLALLSGTGLAWLAVEDKKRRTI